MKGFRPIVGCLVICFGSLSCEEISLRLLKIGNWERLKEDSAIYQLEIDNLPTDKPCFLLFHDGKGKSLGIDLKVDDEGKIQDKKSGNYLNDMFFSIAGFRSGSQGRFSLRSNGREIASTAVVPRPLFVQGKDGARGEIILETPTGSKLFLQLVGFRPEESIHIRGSVNEKELLFFEQEVGKNGRASALIEPLPYIATPAVYELEIHREKEQLKLEVPIGGSIDMEMNAGYFPRRKI